LQFTHGGLSGLDKTIGPDQGEDQAFVSVGSLGAGGDGAAQTPESGDEVAGAQIGETEFAFEERIAGIAAQGGLVGFGGARELAEVVKGVGGEFCGESSALAELLGVLEAGERRFVAIEFGESDPWKNQASAKPGSIRQARSKSFRASSALLKLSNSTRPSRDGPGSFRASREFFGGPARDRENFWRREFPGWRRDQMMDEEGSVAESAPAAKNFRADAFVDAADEADFGVATEEADVLVLDVSRILRAAERRESLGWPGGPKCDR